ncbi:MAG: MinD/ParA family protein [Alphaproteobacteria bacterium]|nr:MinD/ParA family protein [Alphaproteobacteria bacterium]
MTTRTEDPQTAPPATTAPKRAQRLIAVASGKGGVGKTWFSIGLAHALSKQGKKVLLFDGDLGLANVDVQLGLMAKRDLSDVIEGNLGMARVIERHDEGGFDVIAGRSGQGALASLPLPRLQEIVEQLRMVLKDYDAIIIDLGAGIDRTVRYMSACADTTFVVSTDEPTSLTDAYAFIKLSHAAGHADNIRVVVNMTGSEKEGQLTYTTLSKACQNFLKFTPPLMGLIRQDKRVREAIRAQALFLTRSPNSETAEDLEKIAAKVAQEILA